MIQRIWIPQKTVKFEYDHCGEKIKKEEFIRVRKIIEEQNDVEVTFFNKFLKLHYYLPIECQILDGVVNICPACFFRTRELFHHISSSISS